MKDKMIIKLSDILQIERFENVKIKFNMMFGGNWSPTEIFNNKDYKTLLEGHYSRSFKVNDTTIGFIRISKIDNAWLLFHVGKVTKELNIPKGTGIRYEYETLNEYQKFFGRLIIKFNNKTQNVVRKAISVIDKCEVMQILPDTFDNDIFPGYDRVNVSWLELARIITKESWKTALQNQKGVYLLTDVSNGKMYVGSAYGEYMLLSRWQSYIKAGHGGNVGLKKLGIEHIKNNFRFSILDIYKSTTDDQTIIDRENWWKNVLKSKEFGYNEN
jgi:hypothetical protein